jgi:hypothetical protein
LELHIASLNETTDFTLVVEYTGDEVALFDGMVYKSASLLSTTHPRHFYFELVDESTIVVFLYPQNNNKFIIVGKLVEWKEYVKA